MTSVPTRRRAPIGVLATITSQIETAADDLRVYRPLTMDWKNRSLATAGILIPWLLEAAPGMKNYVQDVLNAPTLLRSMWAKIRAHVGLPREQMEAFDRQLTLDDVLRESVTVKS